MHTPREFYNFLEEIYLESLSVSLPKANRRRKEAEKDDGDAKLCKGKCKYGPTANINKARITCTSWRIYPGKYSHTVALCKSNVIKIEKCKQHYGKLPKKSVRVYLRLVKTKCKD